MTHDEWLARASCLLEEHEEALYIYDDGEACSLTRDALLAHLRARPVPAGWVAVPVEPTPEMIEAAASWGGSDGYSKHRGDEGRKIWSDMLAARPSADDGRQEAQPRDFRRDLAGLINSYSKENGSDTPDFLLADFLLVSLDAFDRTVREREAWYGRGPKLVPENLEEQS